MGRAVYTHGLCYRGEHHHIKDGALTIAGDRADRVTGNRGVCACTREDHEATARKETARDGPEEARIETVGRMDASEQRRSHPLANARGGHREPGYEGALPVPSHFP